MGTLDTVIEQIRSFLQDLFPTLEITDLQLVLFLLLGVLIVVFVVVLIVMIIHHGIRSSRIGKLDRRYPGARALLTRAYTIQRAKRGTSGVYELRFPYWEHAGATGAKDQRYNNNSVVWPGCTLWLDGYQISCSKPGRMVQLVAGLRAAGAAIGPCDLEVEKGRRLVQEERDLQLLDSTTALFEHFAARPVDFEHYCAGLLNRFGYVAEPTRATGDGGYDIVFSRGGRMGIAECKCYAPSNKVGRPLLQKLVGANQAVGASELLFMTTSSFSQEALDYAQMTGINCIDGGEIMRMRAALGGADPADHIGFNDVDWRLTLDDIRPYYPPDFS